MSVGERSIQQQYPLGALTGRPLSLIAAAIAPVYAIIMAVHNGNDINSPLLALASLVLVFTASVTVVVSSSPLRAPFTSQSATFTLLWANAAMLLGLASTWHTNTQVRDDWGPTIVGVMIIAIGPYRPPRELAIGGVLSAILAGFVVLLELDDLTSGISPIAYVIIMITPIVVLTIGAARFVQVIIRAIERWRRRARVIGLAVDEDENTIARSVQQNRVTILNRDVVPFFAAVLARDGVTEEDTLHAREISDSIRSVMVAEADRSWLHTVIDQAIAASRAEWLTADAVVDPLRLAPRMNLDQRSAVRAFIGALFAHPGFSSRAFRVTLTQDGDLVGVRLQARADFTETQLRSEFSPFFAVMRMLFTDLVVEFVQPSLTLQFSYGDQ
ncbi:hypothetical protein BH11ACT2_BH11ACT2_03520 [soil metagenome]